MDTATNMALPIDSGERKDIPLQRGCFDYFPAALAEVAKLSKAGNDKHNPGEELHWARGKSMDHADCIARHQMDRGTVDPTDGFLHEVKVAWRALAQLQEALEARGAPMSRGSRIAAPAEPKPLAWNEGWVCACGATEINPGYSEKTVQFLLGNGTGPVCMNNTIAPTSCKERMRRV